jgi:hypothetical protein
MALKPWLRTLAAEEEEPKQQDQAERNSSHVQQCWHEDLSFAPLFDSSCSIHVTSMSATSGRDKGSSKK